MLMLLVIKPAIDRVLYVGSVLSVFSGAGERDEALGLKIGIDNEEPVFRRFGSAIKAHRMKLSAQVEAEEGLEGSQFGLSFGFIHLGLNELADGGGTHRVHIQMCHPEGIGSNIGAP